VAAAAGVERRIRYKTSLLADTMIRNANSAVALKQTSLRGREFANGSRKV